MLERTSFIEIRKTINRPIILFGSGNIAKKTLRKFSEVDVAFIVDNSENLQGQEFAGLKILSPDNITKDYFVVICSTAIAEISAQLNGLGLNANADYVISPILNDLLAISELEELETSFIFTSGSMPSDPYGGGLYKCTVKGYDRDIKKIYSGPCYGAIKNQDGIYFVDTDKGLFKYEKGKVVHLCQLPDGSRAHGLSYNESNKKFYVTCSYRDSVLEINDEFKIEREFRLSKKIDYDDEPMHHCNDNMAIRNSLFVSMFSSTGNWKKDIFDGCIAEFDIKTGERLTDVFTGLYMPHNIKFFDGSVHVLDSLPGHLRFNNLSIQGTFPAFTRGLDYHQGLYYIGQSKNRNYSKVLGLSNNISIDCGVIVYNPIIKVSRFLQFPNAIGEIHAIVCT